MCCHFNGASKDLGLSDAMHVELPNKALEATPERLAASSYAGRGALQLCR